MFENDALPRPTVLDRLFATTRGRGALFVLVGSIVLSGLVLGQLYGLALGPYSVLVAYLAGGFLYLRSGTLLSDREVIAVLFGSVVGSLVGSTLLIAVVVALTLDASLLNAFLGALPRTIPSVGLAGFAALGGVMTAGAVRQIDVIAFDGDRLDLPLGTIALGLVVFAASRPETAALVPPLAGLSFPGPLDAVAGAFADNVPVMLTGGVLVLVGLAGVDRSKGRARIIATVLVAASLLVAGTAVGNVYASVDHTYDVVETREALAVTFVDADVTEEAVELTVRVENPTDRRLAVTSSYAVVGVRDDPGVGMGPARVATASDGRLPPGRTTRTTVTLPLSPDQAETLRTSRLEQPLTMTTNLQIEFVRQGPTVGEGARNDFTVRFACTLTADGGECRSGA